jgi:hypothetical protein
MGFYKAQPFNTATAVFITASPLRNSSSVKKSGTEHGTMIVTVAGCAPNYTGGIQLVQNTKKPGLTVDVMGWTGPLGGGCTEYKVSHSFSIAHESTISVVGPNKTETVAVKVISAEEADSAVKAAFAA